VAWRVRPAVRQAHFPNYFDASNQRRATARRQRRGLDVRLSPDSGGIADIAAGPFRANNGSQASPISEIVEIIRSLRGHGRVAMLKHRGRGIGGLLSIR
jgi:hypothetical protein